MLTRWGRDLDPEHPHPEHPRPQLRRAGWVSLNGRWEHAFTASSRRPSAWDGPIVVPFSPETVLSGVGRQLQPHEWLWYHRTFTAPPLSPGGHLLLHLGAVDQSCTVWVDGTEVGSHTGGYLPFTLDVTAALGAGPEHVLEVRVRDLSETSFHARGKQRLDRGTIWYTAQSGIWQSVWLEPVPPAYVAGLVLVPHLSTGELEVTVVAAGRDVPAAARVGVDDQEDVAVPVGVPTRVRLDDPRPWTPADPHLHDVVVTLGADRVESYAGLRSLGVGPDAQGRPRLLLNGRVQPHVGVLDQGYWPDGLLTPPSDAAMVHDLETVRDLGFTVLRKHAKIEPLRWYHHCDRLGLLVWQDVVNGGGRYRAATTTRPARYGSWIPDRAHGLFGRQDPEGRAELLTEVDATVELLRNAPSVVLWTPFNEGWGQFDAAGVARRVAGLDPTRPVNHVSGWVDQGAGDVRSFHAYLRPFRLPRREHWRRGRRPGRVVALSEYGGMSLPVAGHDWSTREFGYRHLEDEAGLTRAFADLHEDLLTQAERGLAATVYTQLSDVEDELNGLVTWDREVLKLDAAVVRRVTARLRRAMGGD
ncbi:MAG: glycoside hydrolase family 2 sugar binding [Marmoricola sp.]|nr:glycoside hydrolase family 2 sugar binding [Marmoricola sp.]